MMISDSDKRQVLKDVHDIILASGTTAKVWARKESTERLFGSDTQGDYALADGADIPLELTLTPPEELSQKIDATAKVLPDSTVNGGDRVETADGLFLVQSAEPVRWFGIVTHKKLELVKVHENAVS